MDFFSKLLAIAFALLLAISNVSSGEAGHTNTNSVQDPDLAVLRGLPDFFFTTEAYKREALRVLIEEANRVAAQLNLAEKQPITVSNLIEVFIQPPASGSIGTISTSNYAYFVGVGRKFAGLVQRNNVETFTQAKAEYTWPISRQDTNRAFQVATQIMTALKIDVAALNRDCALGVFTPKPEGQGGAYFIPDYWVTWRSAGKEVAFIEFVEPTRSIRQLHVQDPKYILREPVRVPNLAELLHQTNAPAKPLTAKP